MLVSLFQTEPMQAASLEGVLFRHRLVETARRAAVICCRLSVSMVSE